MRFVRWVVGEAREFYAIMDDWGNRNPFHATIYSIVAAIILIVIAFFVIRPL